VTSPFERARSLVGIPFRPQGRSREHGLDCIGLTLEAFQVRHLKLPAYRLTDGSWDEIEAVLKGSFDRVPDTVSEDDDLVISRMQRCFHFGVLGHASLIHADMRIGRVVETPLRALSEDTRYYRQQKD